MPAVNAAASAASCQCCCEHCQLPRPQINGSLEVQPHIFPFFSFHLFHSIRSLLCSPHPSVSCYRARGALKLYRLGLFHQHSSSIYSPCQVNRRSSENIHQKYLPFAAYVKYCISSRLLELTNIFSVSKFYTLQVE